MSDKRDAAADLAVCAAATPGPYGECHTSKSPHWQVYSECKENDCIHSGEWVGSFGAAEDAKFTLTAITALPHWIERAVAAEAEVERLRAALAAKGGAV